MFEDYKIFFDNYVKQFDMDTWGVSLKYKHTYRVVFKCEQIAKSLSLSKKDIELAKIIGLFHDIGRFPQYQKYNSFSDRNIDHAILGVQVLKEHNVLENHKDKDLILKAVLNHSGYQIEKGLSDREVLFCNLIRDADKLDIWELLIEGKNEAVQYDGYYEKEAIETLLSGKPLEIIKYSRKMDRSLVYLGMFFDLNFPYSKEYVTKHHILDGMIDRYIYINSMEKDSFMKIKDVIIERLWEYVR